MAGLLSSALGVRPDVDRGLVSKKSIWKSRQTLDRIVAGKDVG